MTKTSISQKRNNPLPATEQDLILRLEELGIETRTHRHEPVYTVEESKALRGNLVGGHCKNLFLRDKKRNMWLVVTQEDRDVDLKALRARLPTSGNLSFGNADLLDDVLGVAPGAVTPFALINDDEHRVNVVLDKEMLDHDVLNYHPLDNAATTSIAPADLVRFIEACGHNPEIIDFDD